MKREHACSRAGGIRGNRPVLPDKTPKKTPDLTAPEKNETGLKGFEPLTCGLRVRRYAELSYRPAACCLIMWSMKVNKGFDVLRALKPEAGEERVSVLRPGEGFQA